jgi:hemoglobin
VSSTTPPQDRHCDLATRDEIAEFVTRFYREIAQDDRFHHWFETIAHVDWQAHNAELTDFWSGMLLDEPHLQADDVIEAHRWLHESDAFDAALFDRWLEIFDATLEGGWSGPLTEAARRRGHGIAWAMAKRLTGHGSRRTR